MKIFVMGASHGMTRPICACLKLLSAHGTSRWKAISKPASCGAAKENSQLIRYPAIDPATFRNVVQKFCDENR